MRVRQLVLRQIGPFDDLDLHFGEGRRSDRADVHLLIGPNGTGKTTILQAIAHPHTLDSRSFKAKIRSQECLVDSRWDDGSGGSADLASLTGAELQARRIEPNDKLVFAYGEQRTTWRGVLPGLAAQLDNRSPRRHLSRSRRRKAHSFSGSRTSWLSRRWPKSTVTGGPPPWPPRWNGSEPR